MARAKMTLPWLPAFVQEGFVAGVVAVCSLARGARFIVYKGVLVAMGAG